MRTTKEDFKYYIKCCQNYIKKLELNNWEVYYIHENLGIHEAEITPIYTSRVAHIRLSTEMSDNNGMTKKQYIKITALEEVLHLLLSNLFHYAQGRNYNDEIYRAEEHNIIHKLQKVLAKELK